LKDSDVMSIDIIAATENVKVQSKLPPE